MLVLLLIIVASLSIGALYFKDENTSWLMAYGNTVKASINSVKAIINWCNDRPTSLPRKYPVYIGIDEYGNAYADIIEEVFYPILKNFASYYFKFYSDYPNHIEYYFFASGFKLDIESELDITTYLRNIAEQAVHKHIYKTCPYFGIIYGRLTAIKYYNNELIICCAKTDYGIAENNQFMDEQRKKLKQNPQQEIPKCRDDELEKDIQGMEINDKYKN